MCLLALMVFGSMEFVREGARNPFIIEGFMYSTGVTPGANPHRLPSRWQLPHTERRGKAR